VPCQEGKSAFQLKLKPTIRVTRGWGVMEGETVTAVAPLASDPTAVVSVPSGTQTDWLADDGATFVPSRTPTSQDVRSGGPGQVSSLTNAHAIFGLGHYLSSVSVGLTYISGYTPAPGEKKMGCNVTLHALDALTGAGLGLLWESPELSAYSYDDFTGYSPPVNGTATGLRLPNSRPIRLVLNINNNDRNLQLRVADFSLSVSWSSDLGPEPPVPPSNQTSPAADAATVTRGPLLYALRPKSLAKVTKRYDTLLPDRPLAVDYEIDASAERWNYALVLDEPRFSFDPVPSANWSIARAFDTDNSPSTITVAARRVGSWGFWHNSKVTAQPPPSPVDCSEAHSLCGAVEKITLVPFGATNVRISVFPWVSAVSA